MQDFRIIYNILRILQRSMDLEEFDKENLSPERLGISEPKWCRLMAMLIREGYIIGAETWNCADQGYPRVALTRPEIPNYLKPKIKSCIIISEGGGLDEGFNKVTNNSINF